MDRVDHDADSDDCSCTEARAHLERFLDHECDGDMSERLAAHVASCERCARVADAEVHLREILRSRCAEQAPADLRDRVRVRLSAIRSASVAARSTTVRDDGVTLTSQTVTRSTTLWTQD